MNIWKTLLLFCAGAFVFSAYSKDAYYIELKHNDKVSKDAYFAQKVRLWGVKEYKVIPGKYYGLLVLKNNKISFAMDMRGTYVNGKAVKVDLGMIRPQALNWYAGGFLRIDCKGENLTRGEFTVKEVKMGPASSYAVLGYKGEHSGGTLRMELAEDDDKLQVSFTPDNKKDPYQITLLAYPGEYGAADKRKREAVTASGAFNHKGRALSKNEFWVLFYDAYYDRKFNRGRGCCAFACNPRETLSAKVALSYPCIGTLVYPAGKTAHLLFWDFNNWSSVDALAYLKRLRAEFD